MGGYLNHFSCVFKYSLHKKINPITYICRYCKGAHTDNIEEGQAPFEIPTETPGSCSPFEISAAQERESMEQTLLIYTEEGTTEPSELIEEELVLPHLRLQFQEQTSSEVRLHVKSRKKKYLYILS